MEQYNQEVNFVFNQYFKSVSKHSTVRDNVLPLSKVKITSTTIIDESEEEEGIEHAYFFFYFVFYSKQLLEFCI